LKNEVKWFVEYSLLAIKANRVNQPPPFVPDMKRKMRQSG
jgi:hypothetical protein